MLRIPSSTYRLQLHKDFTFDDAAGIADYLRALGISHVYGSPYLQAAPGSMHGYDVVSHQRVNEELGGAAGHERFCTKLGEAGLGQVLDVVPNHMSLGKENRYWWDVLENGTSSRYASFFDIDWQPQEERLRDKVLVPILGDQYGKVLQAGGIKVVRRGNKFQVECSGQTLPVSPQLAAGDSGAGGGVCAIGHAEFSGGVVWAAACAGVCRSQNDSGAASRQGGVVQSAGTAVRGGAEGSGRRSISRLRS